MSKEPSIEKLHAELLEAEQLYGEAQERVRVARSEESRALNRLNDKQKRFDECVKAIRSNAPKGSDWKAPSMVPE